MNLEQQKALALARARRRKAETPPTLEQRAQDVYGLDPNITQRGTILPYGKNKEGKNELAIPQVGVDLMKSFLLPGHVLKGGTYTPEDAMKFTLDLSAPMTAHELQARPRMSRQDVIAKAPTTEQLLTKGSAKFEAARRSGAKLSADQYMNVLAEIETKMMDEGVDPVAPELHPKLLSVMKSMTKRLGKDVDIGDLQTVRRQLGIAAGTTAKEFSDERRVAKHLIDILDDTVEHTLDEPRMKEARALWRAGRKSQEIEEIVDKATRTASGFENGLRQGFRRLLDTPKRLRGFTETEKMVMREIEKGTPTQKALRWLSKFGPNRSGSSNMVGTTLGSYAGGTAFGGPGAVAVPTAGYMAGNAAERSVGTAAEYLRALAANGGQVARGPGKGLLADMLGKPALPTAEALPIVPQSEDQRARILRRLNARQF